MPMTHKPRREVSVGNPTCLLGFSGRDSVDSGFFDTSTLSPGGVNEVQTATITGSPGGGTFKLGFKGQTTGTIAYNATGATVQTALRALSRIGAGGVSVSGGAGGPYIVTFTGKLANQDVPALTLANNSLTGGTTPTVGIVETTKGDSKFAGQYVLRSGTVLMADTSGDLLIEWDGGSAGDIVGIFDGQREFLTTDEVVAIPVYNHDCVFDKDVVRGYATNETDLKTWAALHACQFKSQGTD